MTKKQLALHMPDYVAAKLERLAANHRNNKTAAVLDLIMQAPEPVAPIEVTYAERVEAKYVDIDEVVQRELAKYATEFCRQDGIKAATVWIEKMEIEGGSPILMFSARWESSVSWHTSHTWCMFDQPKHA